MGSNAFLVAMIGTAILYLQMGEVISGSVPRDLKAILEVKEDRVEFIQPLLNPVKREITEEERFLFDDNPSELELLDRSCCKCSTYHCCGGTCHG